MSKILDLKETHYSVRQKIGDAESISTQDIFLLHSVTPKPPESPYEQNILVLAEILGLQFFSLIGPPTVFLQVQRQYLPVQEHTCAWEDHNNFQFAITVVIRNINNKSVS